MRCLFVFLMLSLSGCVQARPSVEQYTYRIGTQDGGLCSATAVGRDTLLTARHCIKESDSYLYIGGKRVSLTIVAASKTDHVVLRVSRTFREWARFGPSPKVGDEVQFYGNCEGLDQVYRRGYVSGYLGQYMYSDILVGRGDSGAGIFNSSGELVGVVSAVHIGEIIRFAVSFPLDSKIRSGRRE